MYILLFVNLLFLFGAAWFLYGFHRDVNKKLEEVTRVLYSLHNKSYKTEEAIRDTYRKIKKLHERLVYLEIVDSDESSE